MTENEIKYWAWLCCAPADNCEQPSGSPEIARRCWGNWLQEALQTFRIPAEFVGQVNGRGEIIPERIESLLPAALPPSEATPLSAEICQALEQSRCLIVICSPHSAQSLPLNETVRYFKQLGRGKNIFPIVIAGEPNAGAGKDECFVPALRHPVRADGTLDLTRRAGKFILVDARRSVDRGEIPARADRGAEADLEMARIQLIALLLGVGFNGLWQREQKRHFFDLAEVQQQSRQALAQVEETRRQLQEAQRLARDAQNRALENQNLPRDVQGQIQAAQDQAREARNSARESKKQLQEFQNNVRETQSQLEEARNRTLAAESKALVAQQQARDVQSQLAESRNQAREAQNKILELQNLPSAGADQNQEAQNKFLDAQRQVQEFQSQARFAESQLAEARQQVRAAQSELLAARDQARAAQNQVQAIQNETRDALSQIKAAQDQVVAAQSQARSAQAQVLEIQNKNLATRRLTKILALLAVLAALAASVALWQRRLAAQALANAMTAEIRETAAAAAPLNREQIQQALKQLNRAPRDENQRRNLDALAAQIPTEEISATMNAAAVMLDDPRHFQEQLLDDWMQTNLPAVFDWSCQLTNLDLRQRALEKIIPVLAADNFTNTLARLNDLKPAPSGQSYTLLFRRWAATDPVQAIAQRQLIPGQDAEAHILAAIMNVWADHDPGAALNWLESQPDTEALPAGIWRDTLIAGLFDGWAKKDLAAATAACQQLPDGAAKEKAWENILNRQIENDPAAAATLTTKLPAGDFRQRAIGELGDHWTGTNPPTILNWAQSLPSEAERISITNRFITNWAHHDPPAAAQFANQHVELADAALGEIARAWFPQDLAATTNWIAGLPDVDKKSAAQLALVEIWAQTDPKSMANYALNLPAGDIQTRYLTAACEQLAARDLPGTVELLQPLQDAALRQNILAQATRRCDLLHINSTSQFIAAMPPGEDQKAAIKGLTSNWAAVDPETAANWVASFPATNAQPEALAFVIAAWSQHEPAAAAQWLAKLPAGTETDETISAFLDGAVAKYPDYAAQWTQTVTNENQRQKYQRQVAQEWRKTDPTAAMKWINDAGLPAEIAQP